VWQLVDVRAAHALGETLQCGIVPLLASSSAPLAASSSSCMDRARSSSSSSLAATTLDALAPELRAPVRTAHTLLDARHRLVRRSALFVCLLCCQC
jgi:hypothetical protein